MTVGEIMRAVNLRDTQTVEAIDYQNRQIHRTMFGYSFSLAAHERDALMEREVRLLYFSGSVMTLILKEEET